MISESPLGPVEWRGIKAKSRLQGWNQVYWVAVLRRGIPGTVALARSDGGQGDVFRADVEPSTGMWEFAALATSLNLEVHSLAQLRRNRADLENALGEVEN